MPDWAGDERFNVIATYPPGPKPTEPETRTMLRELLDERFGLKIHRAFVQLGGYSLVLAHKDGHLGPQIHSSAIDCAALIAEKRSTADGGGASTVTPSGKRPVCRMIVSRKFLSGGARTMADLAQILQVILGAPVMEKTGLKGSWDIDLKWSIAELRADNSARPTTSAEEGPSVFTALQQQLGLKLQPVKGMFPVWVVDAVNRPTPN